MSAQDNLNKEQFRLYHGTSARIKGRVIKPSKQRGDEWGEEGPHAAFASDRIDVAATYGKHVYEVHPTGYEDDYGSNVYASEGGFKIKRRVPKKEVEHHVNVVGPKLDAENDLNFRKWMGANNHEQWHHEGEGKVYHVRYDKEGNEYKTLLKPGQTRPGDPVIEGRRSG